jgi:flagellar biosynthesis GTPase FlhF
MALASQVGGGRERRVALCLPAATRWTDAARAVRIFGCLAPTEVIATKLDETDLRSGIVHASCASGLPVSTLTFGHRVPEDIAPATTSGILDAVMFGAPTGSAS